MVFYHCIVKHIGIRDTLNTLRLEYWIPEGRSYVNQKSYVKTMHSL